MSQEGTPPDEPTRWAASQPATWSVGGFLIASLMALTAPASTNPVGRVGAALLLGGVVLVVTGATDRSLLAAVLGAGSIAGGGLLASDPARFELTVSWAVAVVAAVLAFLAWRKMHRNGFEVLVATATALLIAASGLLFVEYQRQLLILGLGLVGICGSVFVATGISVASRIRPDDRLLVSDAARHATTWMNERLWTGAAGEEVESKLFFEGEDRRRMLIRFYALMAFASVIASFGVLTDSTAVVIGAMLIAPLLTPLMAVSLSLVAGWVGRLVPAAVTVLFGSMVPIATGVITTAVVGRGVDTTINTQIVSRASPRLIDLGIALAAGAAGAYAISRRDVSDSLPGVAIAIALVPPLAVVGVAAQLGDWSSATGALLLYATNALAILAMGALTFVLTGVAGSATRGRVPVGRWVVAFAAAGLAVLWGLVESTENANRTGAQADIAGQVVEDWSAETGYRFESLDLTEDAVTIVLSGDEPAPEEAVADLADRLSAPLGPVSVEVRVDIQSQTVVEPIG